MESNGSSGILQCTTTFSNQFRSTVQDTLVEPVLQVTGDTATSVIKQTGETIGDIGEVFGISNISSYWWVILIICILCISMSFAIVFIKS